jgi:hypothetical protein
MPSYLSPSANDESGTASAHVGGRPDRSGSLPHEDGLEPLIDRWAIRDLAEDFDDPAVARGFALDFAHSLEGKYRRLADSVEQRDRALAKEAALSVKVTSIMVGALRLAQLAVLFERFVDDDDMDSAGRALARMDECASATRTELLETHDRLSTITVTLEPEAPRS